MSSRGVPGQFDASQSAASASRSGSSFRPGTSSRRTVCSRSWAARWRRDARTGSLDWPVMRSWTSGSKAFRSIIAPSVTGSSWFQTSRGADPLLSTKRVRWPRSSWATDGGEEGGDEGRLAGRLAAGDRDAREERGDGADLLEEVADPGSAGLGGAVVGAGGQAAVRAVTGIGLPPDPEAGGIPREGARGAGVEALAAVVAGLDRVGVVAGQAVEVAALDEDHEAVARPVDGREPDRVTQQRGDVVHRRSPAWGSER